MLTLRPCTITDAKAYCLEHHRHLPRVQGGLWAVACEDGNGTLRGVAIASRPLARVWADKRIVEITRCATDGSRNACSLLYGACARAARDLGYAGATTTILASEPGTSLRAAGWVCSGRCGGAQWNVPSRGRQLRLGVMAESKTRWWAPWGVRL